MTPFEQAVHCENAGEYGKAFELFKRCLSGDGHDQGDLAFHMGWCLENDNKGGRLSALQYYEQAFAIAPSIDVRVNSAFRSGWVLMQERDHERAEAAFRKAAALAERSHLDNELYHNALFWHAVCLENKGQYLDAVERYRLVAQLSPSLAPESRCREIICHSHVGRYEEALALCRACPAQAPAGFDPRRYAELYDLAKKEEALLARCLGEDPARKEI